MIYATSLVDNILVTKYILINFIRYKVISHFKSCEVVILHKFNNPKNALRNIVRLTFTDLPWCCVASKSRKHHQPLRTIFQRFREHEKSLFDFKTMYKVCYNLLSLEINVCLLGEHESYVVPTLYLSLTLIVHLFLTLECRDLSPCL